MSTLKVFYPQQLQDFLQAKTTFACESYIWPEWHHQGREQFYFWALLPESETLESQTEQVKQQLTVYLLPDYHKKTHITLYAAGFLNDKKSLPDDVSEQDLQEQIDLIQSLNLKPVEMQVGPLNSFLGAPFIEVHDSSQQLGFLHKQLCQCFGSDRDGQLIPHITLGLYQQAYSCEKIIAALQTSQQQSYILICDQIHLLRYSSADIRSALEIQHSITLKA